MPDPFYIQNPWTGLVIDIGENLRNPPRTTPLRANPKATSAPGNQYQLWTFVEFNPGRPQALSGYYFLKNANPATPFVIDIDEVTPGNVISPPGAPDTLRRGSGLDANTEKSGQAGDLDDGHPDASNQLWLFTPADEPGLYFIQNWLTSFVIDIAEGNSAGKPGAGAHLDAWPQKTGSDKIRNQLWQFVDPNGTPVKVPGSPTRVINPFPGGSVKG